jgi:hypothetical protein
MEDQKALAKSIRVRLNLEYNAESVKFIEGYIETKKKALIKDWLQASLILSVHF